MDIGAISPTSSTTGDPDLMLVGSEGDVANSLESETRLPGHRSLGDRDPATSRVGGTRGNRGGLIVPTVGVRERIQAPACDGTTDGSIRNTPLRHDREAQLVANGLRLGHNALERKYGTFERGIVDVSGEILVDGDDSTIEEVVVLVGRVGAIGVGDLDGRVVDPGARGDDKPRQADEVALVRLGRDRDVPVGDVEGRRTVGQDDRDRGDGVVDVRVNDRLDRGGEVFH